MMRALPQALVAASILSAIGIVLAHANTAPPPFAYFGIPIAFVVLSLVGFIWREGWLLGVDHLNTVVGQLFSWTILALTLAVCYEVVARYVFNAPTNWAYDVSYMLYGTLFMMAGGYALSRNGHVRGDFLYRQWSARTQAWTDLVLYILFFFPGIIALVYSGWDFARLAYLLNERSSASPDGPIIWPFKAIIPVVGVLMLLQGFVEVARCVQCIRSGEWPPRAHDVEELEKLILEEAEAKRLAEEAR
ncbi:MAG: TRAP transporter small permease subunit [Hyphomicrobiaceae bacterium]|nr:TRAP transporter small permease subunit [Hyphomicrobiaceae bacterium]